MTLKELKFRGNLNIILAIIIYCVLMFFFVSCDVIKNATNSKDRSSGTETTEHIIYRKGDTVHYEVPIYHYNDTVIYRKNEFGTTLKTVYDKSGNISNIDCISSEIAEIKRTQATFQNDIKNKTKDKEKTADFEWLIYVMIGFIIIICFALFLAFIWLRNQSGIIKNIVSKV